MVDEVLTSYMLISPCWLPLTSNEFIHDMVVTGCCSVIVQRLLLFGILNTLIVLSNEDEMKVWKWLLN